MCVFKFDSNQVPSYSGHNDLNWWRNLKCLLTSPAPFFTLLNFNWNYYYYYCYDVCLLNQFLPMASIKLMISINSITFNWIKLYIAQCYALFSFFFLLKKKWLFVWKVPKCYVWPPTCLTIGLRNQNGFTQPVFRNPALFLRFSSVFMRFFFPPFSGFNQLSLSTPFPDKKKTNKIRIHVQSKYSFCLCLLFFFF